jgi:hypothetical protein
MYIVCLLMTGVSIFILVAGAMLWKGREVYFSKSGKVGVKRYGESL